MRESKRSEKKLGPVVLFSNRRSFCGTTGWYDQSIETCFSGACFATTASSSSFSQQGGAARPAMKQVQRPLNGNQKIMSKANLFPRTVVREFHRDQVQCKEIVFLERELAKLLFLRISEKAKQTRAWGESAAKQVC